MEFFTDKIVINSIELQTQANEQGKLQVSAKITVSYTHLDVYKRQGLYCALAVAVGFLLT